MTPITDHWKQNNLGFDALYTGYLGSKEQINIVADIFDKFKTENNLILIDPVMADNGKLYPGFTQEFAFDMAKLCAKADVIVPNMTETAFMLGIPYTTEYDEEYIKDILKKLVGLGAKTAILTGVSFKKGKLGAYGYDSVNDRYFYYFNQHLPASFHGTGDIFASALLGALAKGKNMDDALKVAVDYTVECIRITLENPDHVWYGVEFESALPKLIELMK